MEHDVRCCWPCWCELSWRLWLGSTSSSCRCRSLSGVVQQPAGGSTSVASPLTCDSCRRCRARRPTSSATWAPQRTAAASAADTRHITSSDENNRLQKKRHNKFLVITVKKQQFAVIFYVSDCVKYAHWAQPGPQRWTKRVRPEEKVKKRWLCTNVHNILDQLCEAYLPWSSHR